MGKQEPNPTVTGQEEGYALDKSPVYDRAKL